MATKIFNKLFILFFTATLFLSSCSNNNNDDDLGNDDDVVSGAFVEIPTDDLGIYDGGTFTFAINEDDTSNIGETFVTLVRSGDKVYTLIFDNDLDAITEIQFIAEPDSEREIYTTKPTSLEDQGFGVIIANDDDGNRTLTSIENVDGIEISFSGLKRQ